MKVKIVYVTLLKPISDPRANKILCSINKHFPNSDTHLIALDNSNQSTPYTCHKLPYTNNRKQNTKLAKALCDSINPDIILFNNIDFYWRSCKKLTHTSFIYDIRENHSKNISHQHYYSNIKKLFLPTIISFLEWKAKNKLYGAILAEKCYNQELKNRLPTRVITLENKSKDITPSPTKSKNTFFITGTLSEEYGTLDAIRWFIQYNNLFPDTHLTVIGKTSTLDFTQILENETKNKKSITLAHSTQPIAHNLILDVIEQHSIGLLPYQNNPCFENKIPTKLYEYLSAKKIIISQKKHSYNSLLGDCKNALLVNFLDINTIKLKAIHTQLSTLEATPQLETYKWENEEHKLVKFFTKLIH